MIDRYSLTLSADAVQARFVVDVPEYYKPRYNACPTQLLPVVTSADRNGLSRFYWGKPPIWAKNKSLSERIINLRAESLVDKPRLRKTLLENRCIVPADGFYIWRQTGTRERIPYRFTLQQEGPFSFPGIWEEFEDEAEQMVHTFTIITWATPDQLPGKEEVMPVLLDNALENIWLDTDADEQELTNMLLKPNKLSLKSYTVSPRIQSPDVDTPSLVRPTPPADQFGNLTLFDPSGN